MKRPLKPEELWVWGIVAATVHPLPGKATPKPDEAFPPLEGRDRPRSGQGEAVRGKNVNSRKHSLTQTSSPGPARPAFPSPRGEGKDIEPNRRHRIAKAREEIGARLDLHGLDQDRAKAMLEGFLARAWDEGYRAVLVITGKGVKGDGILRRRVPEWLAAARLAPIVAGISEAHRRHGGEGALYVALKRKPRG